MVLYTDKTKLMLFSSRQKRTYLNESNMSLNNFDLKLMSNEKILEVHIKENLPWNVHFQYISKKLYSNLWLLSPIRSFLSIYDKLLFYNLISDLI